MFHVVQEHLDYSNNITSLLCYFPPQAKDIFTKALDIHPNLIKENLL